MSSQSSVSSETFDVAGNLGINLQKDNQEISFIPNKKQKVIESLDSYIVRSTASQRKVLDEQVARFVYATNTSFRSVEHSQFVKLVQQLRPGYNPPNRHEIGGHLLDTIYNEERKKCTAALKNETVCLGFDGWSNIHNEPVICVTVTTKTGNVYLIDTIDTSGKAHTAENLEEMAISSIKKCLSDMQCSIRSVVTDNAANVNKMRDLLNKNDEFDLITYGCSAHVLNLLANDIAMAYPGVKEHLLEIIKYFRNNQFANACYRSHANAIKLVLPSNTRWNSFSDALDVYLKSWPTLLKICEENRNVIDKNIQKLVSNLNLKRNAEDMLEQLKPIAIALDNIQSNNCSIADAVYVWKDLKKILKEKKVNNEVQQNLDSRYKMALTPAHFLAYMLDPRYSQSELSEQEKKDALNFAKQKYPCNSMITLIVKFNAKTSPFDEHFFEQNVVKEVTSYEWWKSQEIEISKFNNKVFTEVEQLLTAKASSASVERMFSTFGLVQSKIRNKLGLEKASKLVFLFKAFNR